MGNTKHINGDLSIARNLAVGGKTTIQGNVEVGHNLNVKGWLEAPNIKDINKGVFATVAALNAEYPTPKNGWIAGVLETTTDTPPENIIQLYVAEGGEWVKKTGYTMEFNTDIVALETMMKAIGCYECDTAADTAAKTVDADGYDLVEGAPVKIKFDYANTANTTDDPATVTIQIGNATAKPIYYNGAAVSATNTWAANEVVEAYYDGTVFQARSITFDDVPTASSRNIVESGGVKSAIDTAKTFTTGEKVPTIGIDSTPTPASENLIKSKGVADLGYFIDNPEWIRVITDSQDHVLAGIKSDGTVEWSLGVPTPVKEYIDTNISAIWDGNSDTALDGLTKIIAFLDDLTTANTLKSMLDLKVSQNTLGDVTIGRDLSVTGDLNVGGDIETPSVTQQSISNQEYIYVQTDNEDKILYGVKTNGEFFFGAGCPQQVKDYVEEKISSLSLDEYEDIVAFLNDYLGSDTTLKILIDGINATKLDKEGLDPEALGTVKAVENPEYIQVTTDSDGRVLGGRKTDGTVVENCDVEYPNGIPSGIKNYVDEKSPVSILTGKTVVWEGDSICADNEWNQTGYRKRIEENCGMTGKNYSVGGSTITSNVSPLPSGATISTRIDSDVLDTPDADYIILEGGTNDADRIGSIVSLVPGSTTDYERADETSFPTKFGNWTKSDFSGNYDKNTFCGAVEYTIWKVLSSYKGKKVGFIIAPKMGVISGSPHSSPIAFFNRLEYFREIMAICEKWGVPYINLWENSWMNPNMSNQYDYNKTKQENVAVGNFYLDGQHPSPVGFDYMAKLIKDWMITL